MILGGIEYKLDCRLLSKLCKLKLKRFKANFQVLIGIVHFLPAFWIAR